MNDGLHYYQRKYPVALHGWCKAAGKGFVYKKRLEIPSEATQTQIVLAVEKQNEIFEDHVSVIRGGNTPKLTEFELRKKAKALLQHQGLAEGMLNAKATSPPTELSLDDYIPYLMTVLSERTSLLLSSYHKQEGITAIKWRALAVIGMNPGISHMAVSQITYMGKSRVTRALDSLVEDGYVTRKTNPDDNRAQMLELTSSGAKLYRKIAKRALEIQFRLASSLTEDEWLHFKTAMIKFDAVLNRFEVEAQLDAV